MIKNLRYYVVMIALVGCSLLCANGFDSGYVKESFVVRTALEFVDAIGSDRVILLMADIELSSISTLRRYGTNYRFYTDYVDVQLEIFGVRNMKISGVGNRPVKIITENSFANVIAFTDCYNVTIDNIEAGHAPDKGFCTGGVFDLKDCTSFTINNTIMYGCGTYGITAANVNGLKCINSVIKECTYGIMVISNSRDFVFYNCDFHDNEDGGIDIMASHKITFQSSRVANNKFLNNFGLFSISRGSTMIFVNDCTISNNEGGYFVKPDNGSLAETYINNTKFVNNRFVYTNEYDK